MTKRIIQHRCHRIVIQVYQSPYRWLSQIISWYRIVSVIVSCIVVGRGR